MVRLDPMTEEEFVAFRAWMVPEYARAGVEQGNWTASESIAEATKQFESLLTSGRTTPDHYLCIVRPDGGNERVGTVWYARRTSPKGAELFVYWVGIDEAFRRRGFASGVFTALEEEARRLDAATIALHVFGDNAAGRALYARLGFRPTNLRMARAVGAASRGTGSSRSP